MTANITYRTVEGQGILAEAMPGDSYADVALQCYYKAQMYDQKVTLFWNGITTVLYPTEKNERDKFKRESK